MNTQQTSTVRILVLMLTVLGSIGGLIIPEGWVQDHIIWIAVVLILGGVPHGASDYLLFNQLMRDQEGRNQKSLFALYYLVIVAAYGLLWWFSPMLAFGLFIAVSFYHFGQSNWEYAKFSNHYWQKLSFVLWGGFVVGVPVLIYHQEAALIIQEITGVLLPLEEIRWPLIFLLVASNLMNVIFLFEKELIDAPEFKREVASLFALFALFISTPLLIGFGIYFVFWHSLGSTLDQIAILKSVKRGYSLTQYLVKMIPLSLLAFAGLILLYWWLGEEMNRGTNIGLLFLFISIITLPHSILMDRFYLININK